MSDGGISAALMAASLVATAASTGMQMYSADQASKSQAAIADYNQQVAQQNAQWQQMAATRAAQSDQFNAQLQIFNADQSKSQAQFDSSIATFQNQQMRQQASFTDMQAELQKNTAAMLRQEAAGTESEATKQSERIRLEKERILGLQRNQFARANVTTQGSPLAILSETASMYEAQAVDTRLLANLNATKLRYNSQVTDMNAGITSLEANAARDQANINDTAIRFNLNQDLFKSTLDMSAAKTNLNDALFAEQAAGAGYRINMRQAEIEHMAGMATSRATQMSGYTALVSGAGQMANTGYDYYMQRPPKTPASTLYPIK